MATRRIAIDCEMVGGVNGENLVARVTLMNERGQLILDKYVKPSIPIGDYRTPISGVTPAQLSSGEPLSQVASAVARIIDGRILIGHSLNADLGALGLTHPQHLRRDLATYPPFMSMNGGQPASLKFLTLRLLGRHIQQGQHSSVEDVKAAMDIYLSVAHNWP